MLKINTGRNVGKRFADKMYLRSKQFFCDHKLRIDRRLNEKTNELESVIICKRCGKIFGVDGK